MSMFLWMAQLGAISSPTLDEVYDSVFDYNDCLPGWTSKTHSASLSSKFMQHGVAGVGRYHYQLLLLKTAIG